MFTQTQQMLDILEKLAGARRYAYHRMDGSTSVAQRARLIDDFNANPDGAPPLLQLLLLTFWHSDPLALVLPASCCLPACLAQGLTTTLPCSPLHPLPAACRLPRLPDPQCFASC